MSTNAYTAAQQRRSNAILVAGIAAITCMLSVLAASVLGTGVEVPPASFHAATWTISPTSKAHGHAPAGSPTAVNASPVLVTDGPARHLAATSAPVTADRALHIQTPHIQTPQTQNVTGPGGALPGAGAYLSAATSNARAGGSVSGVPGKSMLPLAARPSTGSPVVHSSAASSPVVSAAPVVPTSSPAAPLSDSSSGAALTSAAHAAASTTDTPYGSDSSGGASDSTASSTATLLTQPAGVSEATFKGILPASRGGYDVFAQADTALAQQLVAQANATILADLTNGTNGFGVGGYVFPDGAPFGASNPLFTGQSYGPTWYPSSATPEATPSQWAIDPITGLPMDPATGGDVTPSMWATNSWNPQSPGYDPALYTAAGEQPPV